MKTEHLGIEIDRRKVGAIIITEPVHFSPYPQDTRFASTAIMPLEVLQVSINGPLFADKATDEEIVAWWLGSLSRKTLFAEGVPA
jgi:hypothetical protein